MNLAGAPRLVSLAWCLGWKQSSLNPKSTVTSDAKTLKTLFCQWLEVLRTNQLTSLGGPECDYAILQDGCGISPTLHILFSCRLCFQQHALESCGSFEDLTATSQLPGLFLACVLSKPTLDFAILYLYVSIGSHDSGLLLDSNFACQEKLQAAPFFPPPSAVQLSALRCLTFLDASQNKIRTLELMAQTHFKATFLEHGGKMSEI